MNKIASNFSKVYQVALRLYPTRFQDEYGEEMASVFSIACRNKAQESNLSLLRFGLHELRDLPINLVKEHMSGIWRSAMQSQSYPSESFPKSIIRGIFAFGIGFFVIYLIYCLIDTFLYAGNTLWQGQSVWNKFNFLHPSALAYGISAGVMGLSINKKRAVVSALAAFLGYTLLFKIWSAVYLIGRSSSPSNLETALVPFIFSTIAGGLVGSVVGLIQRGWNKTGWYALAGVIGFNLGWMVENSISLYVIRHSPYYGNMDHLAVGGFWYFAYFLIPTLFYAAIVGICMGMTTAIFNRRMIRG